MTDLPITGTLSVGLDPSSVQDVEQRLEEITARQMSIGNLDRSSGGSTRNVEGREQAMLRALQKESNEIATEQLETLDLLYDKVDDIADNGDLLGGGGGDGLFGLLTETGVEVGTEVGTEGADQVTDIGNIISNLIGPAVGEAIGSALGDNKVKIENPGQLQVERDPLPVEEPTLSVDDPSPFSVEQPTLSVDDPSPLGVDSDYTAQLDPDYVAPIQDDPIPVEVSVSVNGDSDSGGESTDTPTTTPSSGRGDGASLTLPGAGVDPDGNLNITGGSITSRQNGMQSEIYGGKLHAGERGLQFDLPSFSSWETESQNTERSPDRSEAESQTVTVKVDQTTNVSADGGIRREILRETESMVDEVQREIDQLRREIRRGA